MGAQAAQHVIKKVRDYTTLKANIRAVSEAAQYEPDGFIGVDLGIEYIATASTGHLAAGRGLNRYRKRQLALRAKLQKKRTKSAKRRLTSLTRKEARHAANINHIISKTIVTEAERTGRGLSLEELKGIHNRVRLRKPQRVALHSWAFAQLADFLVYKAKRAGVPLVFVDPAYTSQTCAECGHVDQRNRVDQRLFICRGCGVVAHADRNASHNIAIRGESTWHTGRESRLPATGCPDGGVHPSSQPGTTSKPGPSGPGQVDSRTSPLADGSPAIRGG